MARYSDRLLGAPPSKAIRSCDRRLRRRNLAVPRKASGAEPPPNPWPFPVRTQLMPLFRSTLDRFMSIRRNQPMDWHFLTGELSRRLNFVHALASPVLLNGRQAREFQRATREERTNES